MLDSRERFGYDPPKESCYTFTENSLKKKESYRVTC